MSISGVNIEADQFDLIIEWASTAPANYWFQVYRDNSLAWVGRAKRCRIPYPAKSAKIDIIEVSDPSLARVQDPSLLPVSPQNHAKITWEGGTYLDSSGDDDVQGFRIYGGASAGGAVDYSVVLAKIPAYVGDAITDGYGYGGFGRGGFGRAASEYSWTTPILGPGTWTFAVVPYDRYGNRQGTPTTANVAITGPPRPPAPNSEGKRLAYTYNVGTRVATLTWSASPTATTPEGYTWG